MSLPSILLSLTSDAHASVFDSIVAIDAGVDQLLCHDHVAPATVRDLVYGTMFTRGPDQLHRTAIFIGGQQVSEAEKLLEETTACFFGPMRVSVMLDPNGSNTTAAAAVLAATKHEELSNVTAVVLAATGPVGQRIVRLLAREGANVRIASRQQARAEQVCQNTLTNVPGADLTAVQTNSADEVERAVDGAEVVFAAGAPGVVLLPEPLRQQCASLRVAIDLNAVPPAGIGGIEAPDKAVQRDGQICYGAVGVGGSKMKIHKAAIQRLFEANDLILDAEEIYELGRALNSPHD